MHAVRSCLFASLFLANAGAASMSLLEELHGTEFHGEQLESASLVRYCHDFFRYIN